VIGGSSAHTISCPLTSALHACAPEFPNPAAPPPQPRSSTPLFRTRRRNPSPTRLPPLCRAGVDWSLLLLHGTIWFFFSAPRSTLVNAICQSTCRTIWVLTEPLAPDQCYGGVTVLDLFGFQERTA
ncbi:Calmodulin-binding transcription activator 2, partial [Zea mays]